MSEEKTPRLREMMPSSNPCTICRAADNVSWLMNKNGFQLYRCEACDHIFVSPHPSDEELSRLYSFESGYQRQEMVRFDAVKRFPAKFVASLEQLVRHVPSGSVLDVGSSAGQLLYLARGRGYAVQGIELSPDTAAIASCCTQWPAPSMIVLKRRSVQLPATSS